MSNRPIRRRMAMKRVRARRAGYQAADPSGYFKKSYRRYELKDFPAARQHYA